MKCLNPFDATRSHRQIGFMSDTSHQTPRAASQSAASLPLFPLWPQTCLKLGWNAMRKCQEVRFLGMLRHPNMFLKYGFCQASGRQRGPNQKTDKQGCCVEHTLGRDDSSDFCGVVRMMLSPFCHFTVVTHLLRESASVLRLGLAHLLCCTSIHHVAPVTLTTLRCLFSSLLSLLSHSPLLSLTSHV